MLKINIKYLFINFLIKYHSELYFIIFPKTSISIIYHKHKLKPYKSVKIY